MYGTILGQEGASLNPGFAKKHDFHKFSVFVKRHILQSKKSSSWEGYTLSNTCMVKPRLHRCSLMVKVLCILVLFLVRREHLWTQVLQKTRFSQILSFHKEAYLAAKKVFLSRGLYLIQHLYGEGLVSIDVHDGRSFMCMVLFLVRREHLWTQVLQKRWFLQIHSFRKEAHLAVKKSLPLKRVIPYPTLVWWSLGSIDVP